jgi:hypothetical protein
MGSIRLKENIMKCRLTYTIEFEVKNDGMARIKAIDFVDKVDIVSFNNGLSERKVELIDLSTGEERSIKI